MAQLLQLLAKQRQGHVRMVFECVLRGCANAQGWEKRKETQKKEKQKEKKKKENGLTVRLYIGFMPLAV